MRGSREDNKGGSKEKGYRVISRVLGKKTCRGNSLENVQQMEELKEREGDHQG